jgi:hypothetical protein
LDATGQRRTLLSALDLLWVGDVFAAFVGVLIVNMKKMSMGVAILSALAATSVGIGTGIANADQQLPNSPGVILKLGPGHGPKWHDWDHWDGPHDGWRGPVDYYNRGACVWVPPAVSAWVPPAVC